MMREMSDDSGSWSYLTSLKKKKKKRKEIVKQMEFQTMSKFGRNK